MKGLKCFGLFLALATMLGLSLNVSLDVSALKHEIGSIPLYTLSYPLDDTNRTAFSQTNGVFSFATNNKTLDTSITNAPRRFNAQVQGDQCVFDSTRTNDGRWVSQNYYYDIGISWSVTDHFWDWSNNTTGRCNQLAPFGTNGMYPFDWSNMSNLYLNYKALEPYSYEYSSYFINQKGSINGVSYESHGLKMSQVLGQSNLSKVSDLRSLNIPVGVIKDIKSDDFTEIHSGTSLDFSLEMAFVGVYDYNLSDLRQSADIDLVWSVADSNLSVHTGSTQCSYTIDEVEDYGLYYNISCPFVSSYDVHDYMASFAYRFTPATDYSTIWSFTFSEGNQEGLLLGEWAFPANGSINVITDHDSLPGGQLMSDQSGSNLSRAPGSVYNEYSESSEDWLTTLTNLFNFSALNPFMPLYAMFNDNSSCASIPIIAGMLHSEDTTYCPWFPSDVRSILTPVLSIAGTMLLFGFFVRWLSSSSGNMFEDQTTHKWGNTQIGQQKHGKY